VAPENLRYTKTHEWVKLEGETARFGLSDFAVTQIKDIVFLDLPAVGVAIRGGEPFGAVETVKAAFDLYAPVSGTVKAVNADLAAHPEAVSSDSYGSGWLVDVCVVEDQAGREAAGLMDACAYEEHCGKEAKH